MKKLYLLICLLLIPSLSSAGILASGSVTQANCKKSLVSGNAFIDIAVDLSAYAGADSGDHKYIFKLVDASGLVAWGYVGGPGGGETLGASILTDGGMENWTDATHLTSWDEIKSGTTTMNREDAEQQAGSHACRFDIDALASYAYISQAISFATGQLYYYSGQFKSDTADRQTYVRTNTANSGSITSTTGIIDLTTSYVLNSIYFTSVAADNVFQIQGRRGAPDVSFSSYADAQAIQPITDCSTNGLHILSTKSGSVQNWAEIEAGFDYNDESGYTYEIKDIGKGHLFW